MMPEIGLHLSMSNLSMSTDENWFTVCDSETEWCKVPAEVNANDISVSASKREQKRNFDVKSYRVDYSERTTVRHL